MKLTPERAHGRVSDPRYEEPITSLGINKTVALPDEVASGHLGRYRLLQQASSRTAALRQLRSASGRARASALEALSQMSEVDYKSYVRHHSLLPFLCFVARSPRNTAADGFWDRSVVSLVGLRSPRARAYLCPACVEADMGDRGYSYWRRAHQLPGVQRCLHHGVPLLSTPGQAAFDDMPSSLLGVSTASPEGIDYCEHPLAVRFRDTAQAMLAAGRSWPAKSVRAGLLTVADELQLRLSPPGRRTLLSDLAVAAFPGPLLRELVPEAIEKKQGEYLTAIDGALAIQGGTSVSVAIAMTLFFPSAAEAMRACCFSSQSALCS